MPIITNSFEKNGHLYDKVKQIAFERPELSHVGKFRHETKREGLWGGSSDFNNNDGVYIYETYQNPLVAYRIYKALYDYGFDGQNDHILIQELQERKNNIKLTQFPTGVLTLNGNIIGQEIPFFQNNMTIYDYVKSYKNSDIFKIYFKIIEILEELYNHGIYYTDIHGKNFLININDLDKINLIDFEYYQINFDKTNDVIYRLFTNLKSLIKILNEACGFNELSKGLVTVDNFSDMKSQIHEMQRKVLKKTL